MDRTIKLSGDLELEIWGTRGPYHWQLYRDNDHLLEAGDARNHLVLMWQTVKAVRRVRRQITLRTERG